MGCLLIIAGIVTIAYSYGNAYLILLGVVLIIWGISKSGKDEPKKTGKGRKKSGNAGKSGSESSDCGYDGPIHTGRGRPTTVHRSVGSDVDTSGYGWQDSVTGGRENVYTGESVEKDIYGNWSYTDSDGETDDYASFDYDD